MTPAFTCTACGEADQLTGEVADAGIRIRCDSCGATWMRDSTPTCGTCGGTNIIVRPRTLTQYSRGTQLSIVGWQDVPCCTTCDAVALRKSTFSNGPLPAGYRPAALGPPSGPKPHANPTRN